MSEPTIRACAGCGALQSYARPVCSVCRGRAFVARAVPLPGTIYSMTTVQRAPSPAFADAVPYTIGLIRGPTGGMLMMQMRGFPTPPAIGAAVSIEAADGGLVACPPAPGLAEEPS